MPTVSVVIPCYNKAAYVEDTIQSVLAQTLTDYELIVVDDGSTDDSLAIVERHRDVAKIIAGPNRGASAARDTGRLAATGRYVQYLDADDLLLPDALQDRVAALEEDGADVAYSDWKRLKRSGARGAVEGRTLESHDADPQVAILAGFWSPPVALLYRKEIVDRIGAWNPDLPVIQDARYLMDAALNGARFRHVAGVSALYREDADNSLSGQSTLAFVRDVFTNTEQVRQIWLSRGELSGAQRRALLGCYDHVGRETFRDDQALFGQCVRRTYELEPGFRLQWPKVAGALKLVLGQRGALAALRVLRRPAP